MLKGLVEEKRQGYVSGWEDNSMSPKVVQLLLLSRFKSCLTMCDPTDGSPPGSPVPGIFQARTLEWVKQCRAGVYCQLSFTSLMHFSTKPNPNSMSLGLSPVK